jgi:hypothetical protein
MVLPIGQLTNQKFQCEIEIQLADWDIRMDLERVQRFYLALPWRLIQNLG